MIGQKMAPHKQERCKDGSKGMYKNLEYSNRLFFLWRYWSFMNKEVIFGIFRQHSFAALLYVVTDNLTPVMRKIMGNVFFFLMELYRDSWFSYMFEASSRQSKARYVQNKAIPSILRSELRHTCSEENMVHPESNLITRSLLQSDENQPWSASAWLGPSVSVLRHFHG